MLGNKTGCQNSDQNPSRISQEFWGHLILERNSDEILEKFKIIQWSSIFMEILIKISCGTVIESLKNS
jgi:hypothetical protein